MDAKAIPEQPPVTPWARAQGFQSLQRARVENILLVASLYDSFILAEDGQLGELILSDFLELNLSHTPGLTRVSSGEEALQLARSDPRHNLIITSMQLGDMSAQQLARKVREAGLEVPVVVLAYDARELEQFAARSGGSGIERIFLWQGDVRILLAIVKTVEDRLNVAHDSGVMGVQVILVVEDSIRFYSSFLPVLYSELMRQSHRLIPEGLNLAHKLMRIRARPKILLCSSWEQALEDFGRHRENVLGVITDVEFPRAGKLDREAGAALAAQVRALQPDVPILMMSSQRENQALASRAGTAFQLKGSATHLEVLRQFMLDNFGFGDFVFRTRDGAEVGRARDLRELEERLRTVPAESLGYHGERNHFSNWLKARTEFALAHKLRPRKVSDFATTEDLRADLIGSIHEYRQELKEGVVADFDRRRFDGSSTFSRIGGGSLGGKARGLAFVNRLLAEHRVRDRFAGVKVSVPPCVVLGTDVFDEFLEQNQLRRFAIESADDGELVRRFLDARFPEERRLDLAAFLEQVRHPLAVRSSSLLEDSHYQPFAGVYETFMAPNDHADPGVRLGQLLDAIKRVYASTFSARAKAYLAATPYRLEEEKMAVILQKLVGRAHQDRFYPDFAGVARSLNFYPTPPMTGPDGIAAVALGLGEAVVGGERCVLFCPRLPRHQVQFSSVKDMLANSQREFFALRLHGATPDAGGHASFALERYGLAVAEADGTLAALASTWSPQNDSVHDGISRDGVRLVSFAPILKHRGFPLPEIVEHLLGVGAAGTSTPVEVEFAGCLGPSGGELGFLQLRPLALSREMAELDLDGEDPSRVLCRSTQVMGNGKLDGLRDAVVVDFHRFDRSRSRDVAQVVARLNRTLAEARVPYLLVGVGRWGSADPFLGIPVSWDQISAARVIVESGFRDFKVTPSQGTHFFQNLISLEVGYFTINPDLGDGSIDWEWLDQQPAVEEAGCVRHLRFERPLVVKMNGRRNEGVILKP